MPLFANLKHTQTHTFTYTHIHIRTHKHTQTHTNTHTHTHAHTRLARYTNPKRQILETRTERIINISVDYIVNFEFYKRVGWLIGHTCKMPDWSPTIVWKMNIGNLVNKNQTLKCIYLRKTVTFVLLTDDVPILFLIVVCKILPQ